MEKGEARLPDVAGRNRTNVAVGSRTGFDTRPRCQFDWFEGR
jgi:hypothetical protein